MKKSFAIFFVALIILSLAGTAVVSAQPTTGPTSTPSLRHSFQQQLENARDAVKSTRDWVESAFMAREQRGDMNYQTIQSVINALNEMLDSFTHNIGT